VCVRDICTNEHLCQFMSIYITAFPAFPRAPRQKCQKRRVSLLTILTWRPSHDRKEKGLVVDNPHLASTFVSKVAHNALQSCPMGLGELGRMLCWGLPPPNWGPSLWPPACCATWWGVVPGKSNRHKQQYANVE